MIEQLAQIKNLRKKFGLKQKELADASGVSQSLIAKIEAGKIDPTFTKVKQIFQALENLRENKEPKAKDLMNKKVLFTKPNEKIKEIIKIMKKRGISQMPVLDKGRVCGIVSESSILKKILTEPEKINSLQALDIIDEVPPIVSVKAGIKTISELLRDNNIILVAEKGNIKGIISKSDLLEQIEA